MKVNFKIKDQYKIDDLIHIMQILRSDNGCPWDREQDHKSIRKNFIEETYEVIEAIDTDDTDLLKEELGDVLLQVVFHSQIESEKSTFTFDDVANDICKKLIIRHPHIFADVKADDPDQVLKNWEEIKKTQKGQKSQTEALISVSNSLPALMRSSKVQKKAAQVGFDYDDIYGALSDLKSEITELEQALKSNDVANASEEIGDILFAAVNVTRFLKIDAEESLTLSCNKFINRFKHVESMAKENGIDMNNSSIEELDVLWKKAKTME